MVDEVTGRVAVTPIVSQVELVERVDRLLPQTQCRQCGFDGCRPYAEALVGGHTTVDRCAPGGMPVMRSIARTLEREAPEAPAVPVPAPRVARVVEAECIGCTKCIAACPVDAIVGAPKFLHTVLPAECTGCELCVPPCPTDCIELVPVEVSAPVGAAHDAMAELGELEWEASRPARLRARFRAHQARGFRPLDSDSPALARLETLDVSAELDAVLGRSGASGGRAILEDDV